MTRQDRLILEILRRGLDDWVQASEVASLAMAVCEVEAEYEVRAASMAAVQRLIEDGLMSAGDVTVEGFREWKVAPAEAVMRISNEWRAFSFPQLGEVCWLSNTQKGDELVRNSRA